jgi:hypothetical protein
MTLCIVYRRIVYLTTHLKIASHQYLQQSHVLVWKASSSRFLRPSSWSHFLCRRFVAGHLELQVLHPHEVSIHQSKLCWVVVIACWAGERQKQRWRCHWPCCGWLRWQHGPGYRHQSRLWHFACFACCSQDNQYKHKKTNQPANQEEAKAWVWRNDLDKSLLWIVDPVALLPPCHSGKTTTSRIRPFKTIVSYGSFEDNSKCLMRTLLSSLPNSKVTKPFAPGEKVPPTVVAYLQPQFCSFSLLCFIMWGKPGL